MIAAELIEQAAEEGVTLVLSPAGKIKATGVQVIVDKWLPVIRDNKQIILFELQREFRRAKVLALLEEKRFALIVEDDKTDPVIVAVGIRDVATFELEIPLYSYDGLVLLDLIEKHYGGIMQ
jgi:hypothetical protein